MDVFHAIEQRRSIKKFTDRPVGREEIEKLLELAVHAPNHRMTQPWEFLVLGPEARRAYGEALGRRKAKKVEDPAAADAVRRKVAEEHATLPAMVVVTVNLDESPEIREEDYAASWAAIQNIALGAWTLGLGTHIKTGAVMDDPELRSALGVPGTRRIVASIHLGEPAAVPDAKPRAPATEKTRWLD